MPLLPSRSDVTASEFQRIEDKCFLVQIRLGYHGKELKLRGVRFHLVLKTRFFAPNVSIMPPGIFFQEKLVKLQRGIQALNISKCSTYSFLHGQMSLTFGTISPWRRRKSKKEKHVNLHFYMVNKSYKGSFGLSCTT